MTDSNTAATGVLVSVKTLTAQNIVAALGLEQTEEKVKAVEQHVADEVNAIQAHFAMVVTDIKAAYEADVVRVQSAYSYVKTNPVKAAAALIGAVALGVLLTHFV